MDAEPRALVGHLLQSLKPDVLAGANPLTAALQVAVIDTQVHRLQHRSPPDGTKDEGCDEPSAVCRT